jgi:ABC-2 type transport system ATP-binding protein
LIQVRELTKVFGNTLAVDHVSFDVAQGQIVGFLGPNGAGKSTTLRMLTCYLPPTSGTATVGGLDIFHQSDQVRQNLGYLPENVPLYTEMKVDEYLDFRGRLRRLDRGNRRQRIDYVIDRCWLSEARHKTIGHLSKGFRQRVGLADALLHNPPVLILDEPTVGLDPTQIRETRKLVKELGGQHTVMLSTHILPEVEAVCDCVVVIAGGRIVAQGTPQELRNSRRLQARVLVECRGPAKDVAAALSRVGGVDHVEILPGEPVSDAARTDGNGATPASDIAATDGQYVVAAVRPKENRDVREDVARAVIAGGWPLREIRLERATLEEFFIQVTANQAAAQSP